jgi:hypothetical protein
MYTSVDKALLVIEVPLTLGEVEEAVPVRTSLVMDVRVDDPVTEDAVDNAGS